MAIQVLTTGRTLVKKIIVGVPLTKNVSTAASVDNLVGINTNGKQDGDVLLYDSDAGGNYVTTSLVDLVRSYISAGGDLSYDSATGQFSIDVEEIYTAENFDSDFGLAIQTIDGDLLPNLDSAYDLGSPTKKWKELHLSGSTIYLGNISLIDQAGSFAVKDSTGAAAPFSLDANTTNDLAEGDNLYYTRARFDSALADGLSADQIREYFDGGTGVTYDSSTGVFSIGQPVATTDDVTFNNVDVSGELVVQGNLTVQGTTTTINSTTVSINDKNIVLADSAEDAAAADGAGITINGADASLNYSASEDKFVFDKGVIAPNYQGVYLGFDSDLARTSTVQSIRGYFNAAGDLSYNSATGEFSFDVEQVYTKANFDSDFNDALDEASINGLGLSYNSSTNTISITNTGVTAATYGSATRIPVFTVNAQGQLTLATETSVASVESIDFDSATGNFNIMTTDGQSFNAVITLDPYTTSDLAEGSDLYYTRARFDSALGDTTSIQSIRSYLNAGGDMSYDANTGTFSINVEEIYTKANFDSDFNVSIDEAALNGDGLSYNSGTNTLSITATGVDSGTYGSTTQIPVFTVNDRGQIDSIGTVLVAGVSSTSYDSSSGQLTINTADGNSFVTTLHDSADHVSRARYAITSVDNGGDGSFTYNASTGVLTYTGPSAAEVRSHFSASGDLSYDSATGQFSFDVEAVYTKANFDSDFNTSLDEAALGGTGLTYNSGTNTLDITNTGVVAGEYGSATQIPIITVNAQGQIDSIGEILVAGVTDFNFDSSNGQFTINTADGGSFTTVATLDPYTTTDLVEGDNLYYTTARADSDAKNAVSAVDAGGDGSFTYNNGSGVFTYTGPSAAETRAHFSGGTGVDITTGVVSIGQPVETTSDVTFNNIATTGYIDLARDSGNPGHREGRIFYDSANHAFSYYNEADDVTVNIAQEFLIRIKNTTGAQINNGAAVHITGEEDGFPTVTLSQGNSITTQRVDGIATHDIVDDGFGYITRFGFVNDVNTGGLAVGGNLYLSKDVAGGYAPTEFSIDSGYPMHIGKVLVADSSAGRILVDPWTEALEYLRIDDELRVDGPIRSLGSIQGKTITLDGTDPGYNEGTLFYDSSNGALGFYGDEADITLQIGQEEWIRVFNNSGSLISNGTPVYLSGQSAGLPTIAVADATDEIKVHAIGLATHSISNGSVGYVTTRGVVNGIDTSALAAGDKVHVGVTPGTIQKTAPGFPNYAVDLGYALNIDSNGSVYVNVVDHTFESIRVTQNARIDGDLTVGGNFNLLGSQTLTQVANLQVANNFIYIGAGDTVLTNFGGSGLNDATFKSYYEGDSNVEYNVEIIGTDSTGDTIKWYFGGDSTGLGFDSAGGQTSWNLGTDGNTSIPLRSNIKITFEAINGHDSGDRWYGDAAPTNVDLGLVGNYNTPDAPYTHAGIFRDATDQKFKIFNKYDAEVEGDINVNDSSFELGTLVINHLEISAGPNQTPGKVMGDLAGLADRAKLLDSAQDIAISGDITAAGVAFNGGSDITLTANITAGAIVNADINAAAGIVDTKLATISTVGKVQNSATTATALNTGSAIVTRDPSGNFAAGTITAALTGTASNASNLNSQAPSYYLDYTNFTNVPTVVSTFTNDANYLDSTTVLNVIDATYIDGLVDSVDNATNAINATNLNNQAPSYYLDYTNFTNVPTNVSTFVNDANYLDSTTVTAVINSAYIDALVDSVDNATNAINLNNQNGAYYLDYGNFTNTPYIPGFGTDYVDSAAVSAIIIADVDAAYVNALVDSVDNATNLNNQNGAYYLNYDNFTNTPYIPGFGTDYVDSATVSAIIANDVDAAFINALTIDADTLNGNAGSHYLDYGNFTNTPTIPSLGTDYVDSAQVVNLVDSDYVTARVTIDADPAGTAVAMAIALG